MHLAAKRLPPLVHRKPVSLYLQRPGAARSFSGSVELVKAHELRKELCQHIDLDSPSFGTESSINHTNTIILSHLMDFFTDRRALPKTFLNGLLDFSLQQQLKLPNILRINRTRQPDNANLFQSVLAIVGDVHGQYDDFAQIFRQDELGGFPTEHNQFIFNGDMVDRGSMGLEIMTVLLVSKLLCPSSVHLLRGNHESRWMNKCYGFQREVESKYDVFTFDKFSLLFEALPVAAMVENQVFVTHGGVGQRVLGASLEGINALDRTALIGDDSALSELVWCDPSEEAGFTRQGRSTGFGHDITQQFLAKHDLQLLVRSHEVKEQGFEMTHNGRCCTVFSAPRYCGRGHNFAAVLRFMSSNSMDGTVVRFKSARGMEDRPVPCPLSVSLAS